MATNLIIVRHGTTKANEKGLLQGWDENEDTSLSEKGIKEAETVAEVLAEYNFSIAYSSPLQRAYKTAEILLQNHSGVPIVKEERLKEINFGDLNGTSLDAFIESLKGDKTLWRDENWETPFPGGEAFSDVYNRVLDFVTAISKKEDNNILIVCHATPVKMFLSLLENKKPLDAIHTRILNCATYSVSKSSGYVETENDDGKIANAEDKDETLYHSWKIERLFPKD